MSSKPDAIRIAGLIRESIVDGPGVRFVVFAQGCPHMCRGCHNSETHDFSGGRECDAEKILLEVEKNKLLSGVTFSGGEPFCQPEAFSGLASKLKEKNINVLAYTGYTYEELIGISADNGSVGALLDNIDILIDGRFVWEERDLTGQFKGSSNQRYIDMNATRELGKLVTVEKL